MPMTPEDHKAILLRNIDECRKAQANENLPEWDRIGAVRGELDHLCALQMDHPEEFAQLMRRDLERSMEMTP